MDHHEVAIAEGVDRYRRRDGILAVLVVGSVARGEERPDSDVDLYLVVSPAEFESQAAADNVSFVESATSYEGAYFDNKYVTVEQLATAITFADEPMRASFEGARIAWAATTELEWAIGESIRAIAIPDEEHWQGIIASFVAQARLHGGYFLAQGEKLENSLLLHHAAIHLVFAMGRAVLAHNRVLFAGPKYLESRLARLENAPISFVDRLRRLVEDPSVELAAPLLADFEAFADWPVTRDASLSRFVEENEQAWLTGSIPPEYR